MNLPKLVIPQDADTEIDHPEIGQTCDDQEPTHALRIAHMTAVDLKAPAFLIGKERFNVRPLPIQGHGGRRIGHICDQIERGVVGRIPDGEERDRPIAILGHPRWCDHAVLPACWGQIANLEPDVLCGCNDDIRGRAADILPAKPADLRLERGSIKLAIAEDGHLRRGRDQRLDLGQQRTMLLLGEMALASFNDNPGQRQGAAVVEHTDHQGDTAATDDAAIHNDRQWLLGQTGQQRGRNGQKPVLQCLAVVFEPAPKSHDQAFLGRRPCWCMIRNRGEMGAVATNQPTDHGHQGPEMAQPLPRWRRNRLQKCPFYGTIAAMSVAHGTPPVCVHWRELTAVGYQKGAHHWLTPAGAVEHIFCTVVKCRIRKSLKHFLKH